MAIKSIPLDLTTTGHTKPRFTPGTVFGPDINGKTYLYALQSGSGAAANAFAFPSDKTYGKFTVTAGMGNEPPVGVYLSSLADGKYGFIQVTGGFTASASGSISAGVLVKAANASQVTTRSGASDHVVGVAPSAISAGGTGTVILTLVPKVYRDA